MTEIEHITSAYQRSGTERLLYVSYRLFMSFVIFWNRMTWLTHSQLVIHSFFSLKSCHLAGCLPTCIYAVDYFCLSALSFTCLCWLHLIFSNNFLQIDKMLFYCNKDSTPSRYDIIWESFFSLPCFSGVLYFGDHSNNSIAKPVRTY